MPTLQAYCDGCSAASEVPPEELLDFDVRCASCGEGTLVIRWSGPPPTRSGALPRALREDDEVGRLKTTTAARRAGAEPVAAPDPLGQTTAAPRRSALGNGSAAAPPAASASTGRVVTGALGGQVTTPPPPPALDRGAPTPADGIASLPELPGDDDPLDPFEAAAQKLDRSVTVAMRRARRHAAAALGDPGPDRPTSAALERPTAGLSAGALAGAIEARPTRSLTPAGARELEGVVAESPPLPAWDGGDTSRVIHLAQSEPPLVASGPVTLESPATGRVNGERPTPDRLAGAVEVVQLEGDTRGPGSRTYDRADLSTPTPAAPPSATTAAEGASPPLRIEDSDWLALIDELTEQPEAEDGPSRVFIRLPEDAAPTDATNQEQVARFQATMRRLEEGGVGPLGAIARGDTPSNAQPRGLVDPETRPWEDTGKSAGAPRGLVDPETRPWEDTGKSATPRGAEDPDTRPWDEKARNEETAFSAPALDPPAARDPGRAEPLTPESSGRMVKEFPHHDLDPALVCARDAASPRADAFRQLYQRIFHGERDPAPRVVLITSPTPGAGKTTVASNLAVVAARIPGRGAVLVDADPRGKGVLRYFGLRRKPEGLLESLQTGGDPRAHVLQFNLGTLDVVPLGIKGSDAPELIASDRLMGDYLERLRGSYPNSVILIDGSSALHAADPLALARLTDGAVVVVRSGHTAREDAKRTIDLLGPERVLGVVFNDG